jgi:hypothetical protein
MDELAELALLEPNGSPDSHDDVSGNPSTRHLAVGLSLGPIAQQLGRDIRVTKHGLSS